MKKVIGISALVLALAGCDNYDQEPSHVINLKTPEYLSVLCLDGVQYWKSTRKLAVRIDPETLAPKRCAGN